MVGPAQAVRERGKGAEVLKRLEVWGKLAAAVVASALLWRPGRRPRVAGPLRTPQRILLVRIDQRVGEALLMTPLLRALRKLPHRPEVHALVHRKVARVLRGHPDIDALHEFRPRDRLLGLFSKALRSLRSMGFDVVVDCANWEVPSVGPAIVSRLLGPRAVVIGPDVWPVRWLHDLSVALLPETRSEVRQRLHLLAPLGVDETDASLSFRPVAEDETVRRVIIALGGRPYAVVNPGGRLGVRRVDPQVFAAAARALVEAGLTPLVTWGPGEEELAKQCASAAPGGVVAPPTSIDQLAGLMRRARLTVCNNTGPMHLSVAVGTPTLALFLRMEVARWGHPSPPHRMLDLTGSPDPSTEVARTASAFARALNEGRARASP
jgi:heptosyltransferase III